MRYALGLVGTTLVLWALPSVGFSQWTANKFEHRGLFGERTFGQPLRPKPRALTSGFLFGPSGNFMGRDPEAPHLRFRAYRPREVQPPAAAAEVAPPPTVQQSAAAAVELPQAAPVPAPEAAPLQQPAPEIGFRSPGAGAGAAGTPAGSRQPVQAQPTPAASSAAPPPATPRLSFARQVAFAGSPRPAATASDLSARINAMAAARASSPLSVTVSGGVATVRGVAKSPYDRAVIAALVLMEPGVWRVNNQLTVESQTTAAAASERAETP